MASRCGASDHGDIKRRDLKTGQFIRYVIDGVTCVWRLQMSPTKLIATVQRGDFTSIEVRLCRDIVDVR